MGEQNATVKELAGKVPIQAYLSYRQNVKENEAAKKILEEYCQANEIALIYDNKAIKVGGKIKDFMNSIGKARFAFIFLTPNYFESAYTLYELAAIYQLNEKYKDYKRFIVPVITKVDDPKQDPKKKVSTYLWTYAEDYYWGKKTSSKALRNELTHLLNLKEGEHEEAWTMIRKAWEEIIDPCLGEKQIVFSGKDADGALVRAVNEISGLIKQAVDDQTVKLRAKVKSEIERILSAKFNLLAELKLEVEEKKSQQIHSDQDAAKAVADYWLSECTVEDALSHLIRVYKQAKREKITEWEALYLKGEKLCGWLLILSVDPIWWFNHQLRVDHASAPQVTKDYVIDHPPFAEVIISRSLLERADYKLNKGKVTPANGEHNVSLFDGISNHATIEESLIAIYKDIYPPDRELPKGAGELIKDMLTRAKNNFKTFGKPIYYLMDSMIIELFEKHEEFSKAQPSLAQYIHFIRCNPADKAESPTASGDSVSLLDLLGMFLELNKNER
ncbi:MAG: hypothetical protein E6Q61_11515 [Nitrosomonas sp.]|nr:MAG: hypothetical protein E6Q61_11515 [Nitrosomonas sp.]